MASGCNMRSLSTRKMPPPSFEGRQESEAHLAHGDLRLTYCLNLINLCIGVWFAAPNGARLQVNLDETRQSRENLLDVQLSRIAVDDGRTRCRNTGRWRPPTGESKLKNCPSCPGRQTWAVEAKNVCDAPLEISSAANARACTGADLRA
eukprot:1810583-Prymnesium_polylepis.2